MADILGDIPWVILGLVAAAILGWKIVQYFRTPNKTMAAPARAGWAFQIHFKRSNHIFTPCVSRT